MAALQPARSPGGLANRDGLRWLGRVRRQIEDRPEVSQDAPLDPLAWAAFQCRLCHGTAATVWLAPRGMPDPEMGSPRRPPAGVEYTRIGVEAGPLSLTIGGQVVDHAVPGILIALDARDAAALFGTNPEFAPFWCPGCAASYCGRHWRTWLVFDEEDPRFFEEQRGVCPMGHERMIQD